TSILVSEQTRINAGDAIAWREIDNVRVVGREAAVRLFQPDGLRGAISAETLALTEDFSRGVAAYRARRFAEAAAIFEPLAETDPLARLYLEWARRYSAEPPPDSWD